MNNSAMYKIGYGLYVLTAKNGTSDNGCIINTLQQVTSSPNRISITVNKQNYTHDLIMNTKEFNVSILSVMAPFEVFKRFGFQSGKNVNKFENLESAKTSENGLKYLGRYANAYLSAKVITEIDLGSHTMFIADVIDGDVLNNDETMTYSYYQSNVKPKPEKKIVSEKKVWVCTICGYTVEMDELPDDYTCPICKHGKSDFVLQQ